MQLMVLGGSTEPPCIRTTVGWGSGGGVKTYTLPSIETEAPRLILSGGRIDWRKGKWQLRV
jgi:hypothetical protein